MCIPAAAAFFAFTAANTILGTQAGRQRAKLMDRMIDANLAETDSALDAQSDQVDRRAVDEMSERARDAMRERGRLAAINAESGLAGNSAHRIMAESHFNEGRDIAAIDSNREDSQAQIKREKRSARVGAARDKAGIERPSWLGAGLQIGGSYFGMKAMQGTPKK